MAAQAAAGAIVGSLLGLAALGFFASRCFDDSNALRRFCFHRRLWGLCCSGCCSSASPSRIATYLPFFSFVADLTPARVLAVAAIFCAHGFYAADTAAWYAASMPIPRSLGAAAALAMSVSMLCALRYSFVVLVFGTSFERSISFHRFIGLAAVALALVHGVLMFVFFCRQGQCMYVLSMTSGGLQADPLMGTLAGLCLLVPLLSSLVRRRWYGQFVVLHSLTVVAFVFSYLHLEHSDVSVLPWFIPALAVTALDMGRYAVALAREHEAACRVVRTCDPPVIELRVKNVGMEHACGQFVCVLVPAVSALPHPVSICSDPR